MFEYMTVRELYELTLNSYELEKDNLDYIELQGWVRTNRNNGSIGFIELNDGTYFKNAQLVYNKEDKDFEDYCKYGTGSALTVMGKLVITPGSKQPFEVQVKEIVLEANCEEDYPLQKKRHSFEFLREISHLRPRANTFNAVFRVRSALAMAVHEFFQTQGFVYVTSPIITNNALEKGKNNFSIDKNQALEIFGKDAYLSDSSKLNNEAYVLAFRDVYSFGPSFNPKMINTNVFANEMWKVESEIAFADLEDNMLLAEDLIRFCVNYVIENCPEEMEFFNKMIDTSLMERLNKVLNREFSQMSYTEAVEKLLEALKKGYEFEDDDIYWGMDLKLEHKRYLSEQISEMPLFIIDSPKDINCFNARINEDGKTAASCDLLVPLVGELLKGAQREERKEYLIKRIDDLNLDKEKLKWYIDLIRFGGCKHAGFELDFDKLVMYVTGMENIRDVIPFSRTVNNLLF